MPTAPPRPVTSFGATPALTSERANPLGTLPNSVLPYDVSGVSVAGLSSGRFVDDGSRSQPQPHGAYTSTFHRRQGVIVGLAVETTLRAAPLESEDDTLREANRLLAAAKEYKLVSFYNDSVRLTHTSGTCVICLEENPRADLILLPCKHQCMHGKCMSVTMRRCPLCRTRIEWTLSKGADGRMTCKHIGGDSLGTVDGRRRGAFDIGEWTPAYFEGISPGDQLLLDPGVADAASMPPDIVNSIMLGAGGPPLTASYESMSAGSVREMRRFLDSVECAALIGKLEEKVILSDDPGAMRDFKLDISEKEAADMIGRHKVDELLTVGKEHLSRLRKIGGVATPSTPADARPQFKLRRRATVLGAERHIIPFHRDCSLVVVNAALNDDFIGAKLVYSDLVRGECARLWTPERALGDVTVHDCTTVHGVSRLAAGVRYNMYIVFEAALTSAAA